MSFLEMVPPSPTSDETPSRELPITHPNGHGELPCGKTDKFAVVLPWLAEEKPLAPPASPSVVLGGPQQLLQLHQQPG